MAQEALHVHVLVRRCIAEQSIEGYLGIDGPVHNLRPVSLDQELGVLVEHGTAGDTSAWNTWHLYLLRVLKVHR